MSPGHPAKTSPTARAGAEDASRLRLIQCGVGGFGKGWIARHSTASPDFELAAIVDISEAALAEAAGSTGLPAEKCFTSLEAALDAVQADAILTVTPPAVHLEHARLAFARGLHVMTEKPIAATLADAKLMLALARKAKKQLVVSQNYRFKPVIATLRKLLTEKVVGEFGHGHLDFYLPADFTGSFREKMEYVLLVDMAIHHLDLIRAVTGRNIVKVFAHTFRPEWSWYQHHCGLKMLMELEGGEGANGLPGDTLPFSYSGDWSARGRNTNWDGDWRLQCSEGSIHLIDGHISVYRSSRGFKNDSVGTPITDLAAMDREGQDATLHSFAQAIHTGRPAPTSGEDNIWSFGAVMAGVLSSQESKQVDVARLIGRRRTRRKRLVAI